MKNYVKAFMFAISVLFCSVLLGFCFEISPLVAIPFVGAGAIALNNVGLFPTGSLPLMVFTAPGGAGTPFTFNLPYLPQFLTYNHAANPLTSLKVSTKQFGVMHDYNAAMIAAMNAYMLNGALPATNVLLRIATGNIPSQDCTISGVTAAAGAINIFANSDNQSKIAKPFIAKQSAILALTPTRFSKFTALFIPALAAATDRVEIEYISGYKEILENQELTALSSIYQNVAGVIVNNVNSYMKEVTVVTAAATPCYILSVMV